MTKTIPVGALSATVFVRLWCVAVGAALTALAAGCSSPQGAGGTASTSSEPGKPKVNRLVFATEVPAKEVNETRNNATPSSWQLTPMYETLLGVDEKNGKRVPALATEWKVGADGASYAFKLRQGVKFHTSTGAVTRDWGEFTARDLNPPFREINKRDSISGVTEMWWGAVKEIEVVSDYEAVIKLNRPDANFLDYVSDQLGGYEIWSSKAFEQLGPPTDITKPALPGTGPYMYKDRAQSQFLRFERVPFPHWKATPEFPEFEFRFIKEASTRMAALLTGEVQMTPLPQDLLVQVERQGYKVLTGTTPAYRVNVTFRCCALKDRNDLNSGWMEPNVPLADARVRRALSKAVNRDELNKSFFGGKGQLNLNNPLAPWREAWKKDWETRFPVEYGYDQAAARSILAQAGYGPEKPARVSMLLTPTPGLPTAEDVAESVANHWRAVGIDVTLEQLDAVAESAANRAYKLTNHARINGTSSNAWVGITQMGSSVGTPTGAGPQLPATDALLKQLWTTLDDKRIEELWLRIGDELYNQHHFVPLFWLPTEVAVDPKIVGEWVYSGSISGSWTHIWNIKAAR